MNCPQCGSENREGARFCLQCGGSLASEEFAITHPSATGEGRDAAASKIRVAGAGVHGASGPLPVPELESMTREEESSSFPPAGGMQEQPHAEEPASPLPAEGEGTPPGPLSTPQQGLPVIPPPPADWQRQAAPAPPGPLWMPPPPGMGEGIYPQAPSAGAPSSSIPRPQPAHYPALHSWGRPYAGAGYGAGPIRGVSGARVRFYLGGALVVFCAIMVLAATFMPWERGSDYGTDSGWDTMRMFLELDSNPFFNLDMFNRPLFSGLTTLITAVLLIIMGLLLVALARKGFAVVALIFFFLTLGFAVTNVVSYLTMYVGGFGPGEGIIAMIVFCVMGMAGSIVALTGEWRREAYRTTPGQPYAGYRAGF